MVDSSLLACLVENTDDVVIITRADMLDSPGPVIEYVNPAFTALTGYAPEEVIGRNPRILQGARTDPETSACIRQSLERGEPVRVEILNYAKDGREYWLDLQIVPLRNAAGELTHFAAIERDLTERHQMEDALRESETRFRSVITSMVEGVVVQDATGFIISCNEAAEQILGLTREQMMGRTSVDPRWSTIHADGSPFPGDQHPSMQTLRTSESFRDVIMGVHKPNDELTWISINTSPIFDGGKSTPDAVVATFHDITEQLRAERIKSDFVSMVSHELRTPLTSIRGVLGLLAGGALGELPDEIRPLVEMAARNTDRLQRLINDLLDLEKIAAGKIAFQPVPLSINTLIEAAVEANRPYARRHHVDFEIVEATPDARVMADEDRIIQVLTNFLSNAAKFAPADSAVVIAAHPPRPDWVRVTVADSGAGIPDEFRSRVFEQFAQAEATNTRSKGGTGLGLAISKALIERHGGKIGFYDNEPSGTVFFFDLPLCPEG